MLSKEEIDRIVDDHTTDDHGYDIWCDGQGVARAIEAKVRQDDEALLRQCLEALILQWPEFTAVISALEARLGEA